MRDLTRNSDTIRRLIKINGRKLVHMYEYVAQLPTTKTIFSYTHHRE